MASTLWPTGGPVGRARLWLEAWHCMGDGFDGVSSPRVGPVAQWLEPTAHNGLVGGSSPPGPTGVLNGLRGALPVGALLCQRYNQCLARPVADRLRSGAQMIRMVMPVDAIEHLNAHAEEARRLPFVDASLHQPSCCCMAQGMTRDFARQLCRVTAVLNAVFTDVTGLSLHSTRCSAAMPCYANDASVQEAEAGSEPAAAVCSFVAARWQAGRRWRGQDQRTCALQLFAGTLLLSTGPRFDRVD
jgi:hypothetical protein